ncbi:hypothetical protein B0H17DRAFT_1207692 [Mycena rosella]|uniref:Uncharacterized protein n=1 Tax=Mycena rosella TaxID=1033263 RepID=A0AAD7D270_MYCRO|nr:hypothetical protein B0H17DRAFT_1207692 [Mycena rosella]
MVDLGNGPVKNIIKATFEEQDGKHPSKRTIAAWQNKLGPLLLGSEEWRHWLTKWIMYCMGIIIPLRDAVELAMDVLWERWNCQDDAAEDLLLLSQVAAVKAIESPREANLFADERKDAEKAFDEVEGDENQVKEEGEMEDSEMEDEEAPKLHVQCQIWCHSLGLFFGIGEFQARKNTEKNLNAAIMALREMRKIPDHVLLSRTWQIAFKKSGLCNMIEIIINPDVRPEIYDTFVQKLFEKFNWRAFLGQIHYDSTPSKCRVAKDSWVGGSVKPCIEDVLKVMSDPLFLVSMRYHCQQIFFGLSLDNWKFEWARWILPTLRSMKPQSYVPSPEEWDIEHIWCQLCRDQC